MLIDRTIGELDLFVENERDWYEANDNNRFAFAFAPIGRYLRFLALIESRYVSANDLVVSASQRRLKDLAAGPSIRSLSDEEVQDLRREAAIHVQLHLEIESFYVFAKVLLDKAAHCVEDYFGPARGLSLRSHDSWCKNFQGYCSLKGLEPSERIEATITSLRSLVADYRDKQIAHQRNNRILRATQISANGLTSIGIGILLPKDTDSIASVHTTTIPDLRGLIHDYVRQLIALINQNRARTRFAVRRER